MKTFVLCLKSRWTETSKMSLRASMSVVLGFNFSSAGKLLNGAERGNLRDVEEVRPRKNGGSVVGYVVLNVFG